MTKAIFNYNFDLLIIFAISGYDVNYYFLGRMGVVQYVKNNFLQTLGKSEQEFFILSFVRKKSFRTL